MMESPSEASCSESWLPTALADALCASGSLASSPHARRALLAWLHTVRQTAEDYDSTCLPLILPPEPPPTPPPRDPFDEILTRLGREMFQLDEYQRRFSSPPPETELNGSILDLFDDCLEDMNRDRTMVQSAHSSSTTFVTAAGSPVDAESLPYLELPSQPESDCDDLSDRSDVNGLLDAEDPPAVPPRPRPRRRVHSPESLYYNLNRPSDKPRPSSNVESLKERLDSDSDDSSTNWSYCAGQPPPPVPLPRTKFVTTGLYAPVWGCRSGFHSSDSILRHVIKKNVQSPLSMSLDKLSECTGDVVSVSSLPSVAVEGLEVDSGDSSDDEQDHLSHSRFALAQESTPEYHAVADARDETNYATVVLDDDNPYEEIDLPYKNNAHRGSCMSVELMSVNESVFEELDRSSSPSYVNLNDFGVYGISKDVVYWKNLLLLPGYNEDEEDEWITPDESLAYGAEGRRPPYIIPRITAYRYPPRLHAPAHHRHHDHYSEDSLPGSPPKIATSHGRRHALESGHAAAGDYSPISERDRLDVDRDFSSASVESNRMNKRFGSNDNLRNPVARRAYNVAAEGSEPELREHAAENRHRKSRSMMPAVSARQAMSPVAPPRLLMVQSDANHTQCNMPKTMFDAKVKRTKVCENGKKVGKKWTENYLVLTQTQLIFYKDKAAYQTAIAKGGGSPPSPTAPSRAAELVIPLRGAFITKCTQQLTSRYAKALAVTWGPERSETILIQDESTAGAAYWFDRISEAIGQSPIDFQFVELSDTPISNRKNGSRKVGESSSEDLTEVVDRAKVRKKLKKFLSRRPTQESLIKKGYYKDEPVFGRRLEEVCPTEGPRRIPEFVERCVQQIESSEENIHTDGLYRASGNLSQVQKIRLEVDQNNLDIVQEHSDVHVLTGSLKLFFRELKEPLIPCKMFNQVLAATGIKVREARIKEFRDIVNNLPQCNYDTLKFMLEHLLRVTEHSDKNRMHIANLAIVFGPTLLWAPPESLANIATDCIQQNHAIEILLTDFREIFLRK